MGKEKEVGADTATAQWSSPLCYLNEVDRAYQGDLGRDDLLALLNEFLEAKRAGAKVARIITADAGDKSVEDALKALAMGSASNRLICPRAWRRSVPRPRADASFSGKGPRLERTAIGCVCSTAARDGLSAS